MQTDQADNREFVYVIKCHRYVKIGVASNPIRRLKEMQTGNPFPLSILTAIPTDSPIELEQSLHDHLHHFRKRGEWFHLSKEELHWLEAMAPGEAQSLVDFHRFKCLQARNPDQPPQSPSPSVPLSQSPSRQPEPPKSENPQVP